MTGDPRDIMAIVDRPERLLPLLSGAYRLAAHRGEKLILIVVGEADTEPDWLEIPPEYDPARIKIHVFPLKKVATQVSHLLRDKPPALAVLGMEIDGHSLVREQLIPLAQRLRCPIAVVRRATEFGGDTGPSSLLIPYRNDENSRFALRTALSLDPDAVVTVATVVQTPMEDADHLGQQRELNESLSEWADESRVVPKLLVGPDAADLLVAEAARHDVVVMGVSQGFVFLRAATGDAPSMVLDEEDRAIIRQTEIPVVILRAYQGRLGVLLSRIFTRGDRFMPTLTDEERVDVYRQIRRSARPTQDFFIMIGSSAGIASMGLLLNSPAVIIGAMLIAPLMSAIIGMGLAIVQGDYRFLGSATKAAFRGLSLAILVGFVIGILDIGTEPTNEMFSRSQPSLLDFTVATVSGFAAAYALCRRDLSTALPGVAIAVALVPPLATAGLFASMGMLKGSYGALLLFFTNLAAITLASSIVFTLLGFRPPPARVGDATRYVNFQRGFLAAGLMTLAVFSHLVVLKVDELADSHEESTVRAHLTRYATELGKDAHLVELSVEEADNDRLKVAASISSPREISPGDPPLIANELERALERPVELTLTRHPAATVRSKGWGR